jgi:hypothetical protein
MTYDQLCHQIRNLVQVAEMVVLKSMKKRRDLRISLRKENSRPLAVLKRQINDHLCWAEEQDAELLLRLISMGEALDKLKEDHGVCDLGDGKT